jgi:hypothetical protein
MVKVSFISIVDFGYAILYTNIVPKRYSKESLLPDRVTETPINQLAGFQVENPVREASEEVPTVSLCFIERFGLVWREAIANPIIDNHLAGNRFSHS